MRVRLIDRRGDRRDTTADDAARAIQVPVLVESGQIGVHAFRLLRFTRTEELAPNGARIFRADEVVFRRGEGPRGKFHP